MQSVNRTANAARNSIASIIQQVINLLIGFVYRTVFLLVLSSEYLGLNGLFTNILSVLSIAELGIGTAIIYRLYTPVSENDEKRIICLMNFYKRVYIVIALAVLCIGALIMPFLKYFIADEGEVPSDVNLYLIYALFLMDNVASYFCAHKQGIIVANQRGWIVSAIMSIATILRYSAMVAVLFLTKNFTLTLIISVIFTIGSNVFIALLTNRLYPFLKHQKALIEKAERKEIYKDTSALMMHRIGGYVVNSTDSILISSFIGILVLGLYSNYNLIITSLIAILGQAFSAFSASIGNLQAKGDTDQLYKTYIHIQFFAMWLTGFCMISYFVLVNPFIEVWLGKEYLLGIDFVIVIVLSTFFRLLRWINTTFINSCGLFTKDKWRPIIEVVLNLVLSIVLVQYIGIVGIFIGTVISTATVPFWREFYILNRDLFHKKWYMQMLAQLLFLITCCGVALGLYYLCGLLPNTIGYFIAKTIICLITVNGLFILSTFRTESFKYFIALIRRFLSKLKKSKKDVL